MERSLFLPLGGCVGGGSNSLVGRGLVTPFEFHDAVTGSDQVLEGKCAGHFHPISSRGSRWKTFHGLNLQMIMFEACVHVLQCLLWKVRSKKVLIGHGWLVKIFVRACMLCFS